MEVVARRRFFATCLLGEADSFVDEIYQEYLAAGSPRNKRKWVEERLRREFLWVGQPPKWVESEPDWPFHDGKPMVFISQTALPENDVTRTRLTFDTVIYLFGARIPVEIPDGYGVIYKTVEQIPGFE